MKSQLVLGGRFRVFEDGSINRVFDGVETEARVSFTCKGKKYGVVTYMDEKSRKSAYVHRLVATAFVPNPESYPQVNHKDGDTRNNAASNLEWVTPGMNVRHAYEHGLINPMATATPCEYCGNFTKSKDGICTKCRESLAKDAGTIDRRAERADRYGAIDTSGLSEAERQYVGCASRGMSVCEIGALYGVSRQCVSAALLLAEKKSLTGIRLSSKERNLQITLVNRLNKKDQKLAMAKTALNVAEAEYQAAVSALLAFKESAQRQ